MRHRKAGYQLNRNTSQRRALFKSLIQALITHEQIKTTEVKAKAIKRLVDKLITKAKAGTLHSRRQIMAFLPNVKIANKLVDQIAPLFKERKGGYTRFIRLGKRRGDDAMMVKMEFMEKIKKKVEKKVEKVEKVEKSRGKKK